MFRGRLFGFPKPVSLISTLTKISTNPTSLTLDYFAGSGTTAHAVINLNRDDGGRRKYILVEQGEYFDTVLKSHIAKDWRDGKPVVGADGSMGGTSQLVKVLRLESYEDTLNNLKLKHYEYLIALGERIEKDYLLHYWLEVESRESLLSVDWFARPFDYQMDIAKDSAGACEPCAVDLVETFNYLLGLRVIAYDDLRERRGMVAIKGEIKDQKVLVLWRDVARMGYGKLNDFLANLSINPQDSEYDVIYINGDHNIATVWESDDRQESRLKVGSIEQEFLALMFGE